MIYGRPMNKVEPNSCTAVATGSMVNNYCWSTSSSPGPLPFVGPALWAVSCELWAVSCELWAEEQGGCKIWSRVRCVSLFFLQFLTADHTWVEVLKTFFDEIISKNNLQFKRRWKTVKLELRKAKPPISRNKSASVGFDVSSHRNLWTKEPHTSRSILVASSIFSVSWNLSHDYDRKMELLTYLYAFQGDRMVWYNGSTKHLLRDTIS